MKIKTTKRFSEKDLKELFISVSWLSGKYPKRLKKAMKNSDTVFSAWDGKKLVGLMSAVSDREMTVYYPYLLVMPEYQGKGIGKALLTEMMKKYGHCYRQVLNCYEQKCEFYKKFGFETDEGRFSLTFETDTSD